MKFDRPAINRGIEEIFAFADEGQDSSIAKISDKDARTSTSFMTTPAVFGVFIEEERWDSIPYEQQHLITDAVEDISKSLHQNIRESERIVIQSIAEATKNSIEPSIWRISKERRDQIAREGLASLGGIWQANIVESFFNWVSSEKSWQEGRSFVRPGERSVLFATNRLDEKSESQNRRFGSKRSNVLTFGKARVRYELDDLDTSDYKPTGVIYELSKFDEQSEFDEFLTGKDVLILVHGYRTKHSEAIMAAAMIAEITKFRGEVVVFSWPSDGLVPRYARDMDSADWSAKTFAKFIGRICQSAESANVHVLAHSMGTRIVTRSWKDLANASTIDIGRLKNIIYAAADEDVDIFIDAYAVFGSTVDQTTLYLSENDRALGASQLIRIGHSRLGQLGPHLSTLKNVILVDASDVDTAIWGLGHSYFFNDHSVLSDVHQIINFGIRPSQRTSLREVHFEDGAGFSYWKLVN